MKKNLKEALNKILLGDCESVLPPIPDDSIDAVITDPPYGMGKIPTWEAIQEYLSGKILETGDFMGKDWELPTIGALKEMHRVLKPGGYCLAFSSTRTFDVLAAAMSRAGFHYVGVRRWITSQGFPKSTNISKRIDILRGVERKVIGVKPGHEGFVGRGESSVGSLKNGTLGQEGGFSRPWMSDPEKIEAYHMETAPTSDDAKKWAGFGTALKPSWEPIVVFSKGPPSFPLPGPEFHYCAKTNKNESTLGGEIVNDHPTKKPLKLMQDLIRLVTPHGGIVLDPYVGSGTTAEAAIREGRQFVAIEKFPHYHDIASKRIALIDATAGAVNRSKDLFDALFG